jgi:hypothetical protein
MNIGRTSDDRHALASELVERCAPLLSAEDWYQVRDALGQMHGQLREDIPDQQDCDAVFADLVAALIERLGCPAVASWDQAQIYATSASGGHRSLAVTWKAPRQH